MSRNRFYNILVAAVRSFDKVSVLLRNPSDEMGNRLVEADPYNPDVDFYTAEEFNKKYGKQRHGFTGVDYVELYQKAGADVYVSRDPAHLLSITKDVVVATVHDREQHRQYLLDRGASRVLTLADILSEPVDGSGYNEEFGLLGANKRGEEALKLFPRDGQRLVEDVQGRIKQLTGGADVHVMVYGDGAFKDPVGGIWELHDPVVSPAFTGGLAGTNDGGIKLKNEAAKLAPEKQEETLRGMIKNSAGTKIDDPKKLGVTPRRISDLVGSLADLTTGSGDKGTPIVHIKGYFDHMYSK